MRSNSPRALAHQRLLHADVGQQLFDLRVGVAELLHQLALEARMRSIRPPITGTFERWAKPSSFRVRAMRTTSPSFSPLASEVTIGDLVQQLAGERGGARGRLAAEHLQVARAQIVQFQTDLGDARQILAVPVPAPAAYLHRAQWRWSCRVRGHRGWLSWVIGQSPCSWVSGSGGRLKAV
jgi:hypothetical protein